MSPFSYIDGQLCAEKVSLTEIAAEVGTPFYCYSTGALEESYRAFADALSGLDAEICYAVKANSNVAVIATLARLGAGADVVSEGEIRRALAAGVDASRIVFSGVGKTRAEMAFALDIGIGQFNVESVPELAALAEVARSMNKTAPVALRINPDVDAGSHHKITTGRSEDKFGIGIGEAETVYRRAAAMDGVRVAGLAVHIGSQLTSLAPFRDAYRHAVDLVRTLRASGLPVERLDLGGGLGIVYRDETPPDLRAYAAMVRDITDGLGVELMFEPGRLLVGNAGVLVTRVVYDKAGREGRHVIVDAAMNDLIRPALYDAFHHVVTVSEPRRDATTSPADVAGPVCETGDVLAHDRALPQLAEGDLLAVMSAGAYGAVMASEYNTRPLVAEVMVSGARYSVIRERTPYDIILARDRLPDWLTRGETSRSRGAAE